MDLRWLSAPAEDVAAVPRRRRRESRPGWVPSPRQLIAHANLGLMLWFFGIACFVISVRVTASAEGRIGPRDARDLVIVTVIFLIWLAFSAWLRRWAADPLSRDGQLGVQRLRLTALANGYELEPSRRAKFISLMNPDRAAGFCYPRFAAPGGEFGRLTQRRVGKRSWSYIAVALPAPLPHFVFESVGSGSRAGDLPARIPGSQHLSLEGDFDRSFALHVPAEYERDALFVVTPDVMAALVDGAAGFHVEATGNLLVFFAEEPSDFSVPDLWEAVDRVLRIALPPFVATAQRYRDERIPELGASPTIASVRAAFETPETPWAAPTPRIGAAGRRLRLRDRRGSAGRQFLRSLGRSFGVWFLYFVPMALAAAGILTLFVEK